MAPNPFYAVIAPNATWETHFTEYVVLRVHRVSKHSGNETDLLGQNIRVQLEISHSELTDRLAAELRSKWRRTGILWTGKVLPNPVQVEIPMAPKIADCSHEYRM